MSSKTKNLGLLKKDPILDKNDTFNIQTMLNDNWDKLDGAVGGGFQQAKDYTDEQISLVTATGIPKLVSYPLQVTATEDNQTNFEIPLDAFEVATDTLIVVINRAFLDASQYTVKAANRDEAGELVKRAEIELIKGVKIDSKISLVVLKNVPIGADGSINGAVLATESVPINRVNGLQDKLDEAFQAGNERKSELVAALIAKGVEATTDDSWSDLLDKINSIIKATGDATAGDIRQGKKATTDNGEIIGTMPTRSDVFKAGSYFNDLHNTFLDSEVTLDSGYYPEKTKVRIQINDSNFKSENIKSGVTIFGEEGSYKGNIREHKGTILIPSGGVYNDFFPSVPKFLYLTGSSSPNYTGPYSYDQTTVYIQNGELNTNPNINYQRYSYAGGSSDIPWIILNSPVWQINQLVYRNNNPSYGLYLKGLIIY